MTEPGVWKRGVAASFAAAADRYDGHAVLQRAAATALAAVAPTLGLPRAPLLLELGCGTGLLTAALCAALPGLGGLVTDIAPPMLAACRARMGPGLLYAALDAEQPALAGPCFDVIAAGLVAQWFLRPGPSLAALGALLRPGGWILASLPAPGSLGNWRRACEAEGIASKLLDFPAPEPICARWPGPGRLALHRIDIPYPSGRAFLAGLAGLGAATPRPGHARLAPGGLRRAMTRFEQEYGAVADYRIACLALGR